MKSICKLFFSTTIVLAMFLSFVPAQSMRAGSEKSQEEVSKKKLESDKKSSNFNLYGLVGFLLILGGSFTVKKLLECFVKELNSLNLTILGNMVVLGYYALEDVQIAAFNYGKVFAVNYGMVFSSYLLGKHVVEKLKKRKKMAVKPLIVRPTTY
ncbi:hypothetical protein KAH94_00380 [bacterium]|nr:hypothetical protein [bacterium]